MIDDPVVKAKGAAAEEVAVESSMKYEMLKGTDIMEGKAKIQLKRVSFNLNLKEFYDGWMRQIVKGN